METLRDVESADSVKQIELRGAIEAPSGVVTLKAGNRVYLAAGSSIDVSGVVATLPLQEALIDSKLNSVELRDAYGQKAGILKGENITTTTMAGSAIGDLSQAILTRDRTALERSIGGARRTIVDDNTKIVSYNNRQIGEINITADDGDIIVRQGASLDFSGGAINYKGGYAGTTKLLSGTKIYDISTAPLNIKYDKILGDYVKTYERFGVREHYTGSYYGGASPLRTYVPGFTRGGDAGELSLSAARIVLDGKLNGSVTRGIFQNTWTMAGSFTKDEDYDLAQALSVHRGLEAPRAGTLNIGKTVSDVDKPAGNPVSISVLSDATPLPDDFNPAVPLVMDSQTVLSAKKLNEAKLGVLRFTADREISTAADARLFLQPGGIFSANSRRIKHDGEISAHAGSINLYIDQNFTSHKDSTGVERTIERGYVPLSERIVLGTGSRLDVSGERIYNAPAGRGSSDYLNFGQSGGGRIEIKDRTDEGSGVFIESGAVVDVSGGYTADQKGKLKGGNAGILSIQGANIMLSGDLRGYALADVNGKTLGGSIILQSKEIHVTSSGYDWAGFNAEFDTVPDSLKDKLYLAGNRFDDTGFTQITLNSLENIDIESAISTSRVRMNNPTGASAVGSAIPGRTDIIRLDDTMAWTAGPSSFTAEAGVAFDGFKEDYTGNLQSGFP